MAAEPASKASPSSSARTGHARAGVGVFEQKQFSRTVAGTVLSARDWAQLGALDDLLERINALHAQAEQQIAEVRARAQQEGFADGFGRAQQQMAEQLAALNERRARTLAESQGRIADLACAIVARIAPEFDPGKVVPRLVAQAVEAAQAEQFLLIRVHPSVREQVAANLGTVRQAHPAVGVIELVDDEGLDALSCVVVSEAGEVRAGIQQQIEAIRAALARANQTSGRAA